jgi:hypothetical protein
MTRIQPSGEPTLPDPERILEAPSPLSDKAFSESYAYHTAKLLLASWLRESAATAGLDGLANFAGLTWRVNRPGPSWGIWTEYPILSDGSGAIKTWDEIEGLWRDRPPSYADIVAMGYRPMTIIDIAVQHKGAIAFAMEIRHTHPVMPPKLRFLREVVAGVLEIPAYWVLGQVDCPSHIPQEFWIG